MALILGGIIGSERERKNKPAGIRTHVLVCVGATIISLIQLKICYDAIDLIRLDSSLISVIKFDQSRLIAQIVSGVGFLGAGTIIVTKKNVVGLTTAATMWAVSALGIAIGMGYYKIAALSFILILFSLIFISKFIKVPTRKNLEVQYVHRQQTKEFLIQYFDENNIEINQVTFNVEIYEDYKIYQNVYGISIPNNKTYAEIIEDLSFFKNITKIRLVDVLN
ncbi:MgtC/SapB family protein [Enterococcus sp. CWB-B31]|uniref:MgtC/SapB family protein n=1 Tax=Enterococcus sp. CWB-B31 TaxID=2885159 RepID=UPI001E2F5FBC|nr:MgtC/SapB family protein [Enterococcus sp. CWB-B31]MCB5953946.1 MgtC/SapB family protein [Enterococcus sp. CWB-B31]